MRKPRVLSAEARAGRAAVLRRTLEKCGEEVLSALIPILRENQFKSIDVIVKLMNASSRPKTSKGEAWNKRNLPKWIDRAIERMTAPTLPPDTPMLGDAQ